MKRHLLSRDELVDTKTGKVEMVVLDPTPLRGSIKIFDPEQKCDRYVLAEALRAHIGAGTLKIRREGAPKVSPAAQEDVHLDASQQQALRLSRRLEELTKSGISANQAYLALKAEHEKESGDVSVFPSRATMYRYRKKHRNGVPALSGNMNKGNRVPRYDSRVRDIICAQAQETLLKPGSRWSFKSFTQLANQIAHDENLIEGTKEISCKYVVRTILQYCSADIELDRLDPKVAISAKSLASKRIRVPAPLMRVEQDAVHLPWVVRTPQGEARNLYLIHSIDCFSGMPMGWYLKVGSPTGSDSLRCIESCVFSKAERFAALGLTILMDCYGAPALIVWDNGPETKSERIQRLTALGIDAMHCRAMHAHGKPFIERLNRSLKEALELLPGCTRFDGVDGQRDPNLLNDLPMTIEELEKWIVRWYFEVWANTPLKRHTNSVFTENKHLGNTPWERWQNASEQAGYPLPLPPERDAWRMTIYEHEVRTLSRKTGISYQGFNFKGENLPSLIKRLGESAVKIFTDPEDFRLVYISPGEDEQLVELVNEDVDEFTPAYSFEQARQLVKEETGGARDSEKSADFKRDLFKRALETKEKGAKPRAKNPEISRETAARTKNAKAMDRAIKNPLPSSKKAVESSPTSEDVSEYSGMTALPMFDRNTGKLQS